MKYLSTYKLFENNTQDEELNQLVKDAFNFYSSIKKVPMQYYVDERIDNILAMNKFKSLEQPKAILFFNKRPFTRFEKEYNAYTSFLISFKEKNSEIIGIDLYKMKSKKGTLYIMKGRKGEITIFTQHFFDRYYQRTISLNTNRIPTEKEREKAINKFISSLAKQYVDDPVGARIDDDGVSIFTPYSDGFGLGFIINGNVFVKTFIDEKQMNKIQATKINDFKNQYNKFTEEEKRIYKGMN